MQRSAAYRAQRAEIIHDWKPWEKSCGPKTAEGKAVVARNAWKGNPRGAMIAARALARLLKEDAHVLAEANQTPTEA